MTTREMANVAGVSVDTIINKTKELFPGKVKQGKQTIFTKPEAIAVMEQIRKRGFVTVNPDSGHCRASPVLTSYDVALIENICSHAIASVQAIERKTIKDIAGAINFSEDTVTRRAKMLYPDRFSQGRRALFTGKEAELIANSITTRKKIGADGNIYAFAFSNGLVKIGISVTRVRHKSFTGRQETITEYRYFPTMNMRKAEKMAHKHFAQHRKYGEFFDISFQDACDFIESIVKE